MQHLEQHHAGPQWQEFTPEMAAEVVGASSKPHRDCPLCPSAFTNVPTMQKHIRYHLERLALYVLLDTHNERDGKALPARSSDSHEVAKNCGRKDSIGLDFDEDRQAFEAAFAETEDGRGAPYLTRRDRLTHDNLSRPQSTRHNEPRSWEQEVLDWRELVNLNPMVVDCVCCPCPCRPLQADGLQCQCFEGVHCDRRIHDHCFACGHKLDECCPTGVFSKPY